MSDGMELDTIDQARARAARADRAVVKAGTNSVTDEDSRLDTGKIDAIVDDAMHMINHGTEVLLVSSGAVGAGIGRIGIDDESIEESQALSTVGQPFLMRRWGESFERYDRMTAQLLLTQQDLEHPQRFRNLKNTLDTLFEWGITPIINENDAVATDEIRIGDNDMLSSAVAMGLEVDLLVTLTDVGGVYTGNPKVDETAELIEVVGANYGEVQEIIQESARAAFGGIRTKVEGARDVSQQGIPAIIGNSADGNTLQRIVNQKPVGTLFLPVNGERDE